MADPAAAIIWGFGASLILFYDCDYLHWNTSDVMYANVGGGCSDGLQCGTFYTVLSVTDSLTLWLIGASQDYFMIVIFLWFTFDVYFTLVGAGCDYGSMCGLASLGWSDVVGTTWDVGASLILFYGCDILHWIASGIRYAYIGSDCNFDLYCGIAALGLGTTAATANWFVGASFLVSL